LEKVLGMSIEIQLPDGRSGILVSARAYGTDLRLAVSVQDNSTGQILVIPVRAEIKYVDSVAVKKDTGK
jgi:TolB-like protein